MSEKKIDLAVNVKSAPEKHPSLHIYPRSERNRSIFNWIVVVFLMFFVSYISVHFLLNQSLRLDESQSLFQTSRSPKMLIHLVAADVHVPLYHLMLHYWTMFLGNGVATARVLSLIFFVLSIPASYLLGNEAYGKRVGLFVAILMAISPFLNWYGSEARMYSLLLLVTVVSQYFYIRLIKRPSNTAWWGYAIVGFLGMFTHYFFFLVFFAQFVFFLFNQKIFEKGAWKKFFLVYGVLAVLYLPWVYYFLKLGAASNSDPLIARPTTVNLFNTFSQFIFGFQDDHLNTILVSLWPISILFAFFALRRDRRSGDRRRISYMTIYFLTATLLPILTIFFASFFRSLYLTRYLIISLPSLYMFIGWIIATFPPRLGNFMKILFVVAMLLTFYNEIVSPQTPVKENYEQAVAYLSTHTGSQDVIVLSAPFTIFPVDYYYHGTANLQTLPYWDIYETGSIPPYSYSEMVTQATGLQQTYTVAWLLLSYDQGYNENVRLYFDTHFQRLDHENFSPGLDLYEYKLRYDR